MQINIYMVDLEMFKRDFVCARMNFFCNCHIKKVSCIVATSFLKSISLNFLIKVRDTSYPVSKLHCYINNSYCPLRNLFSPVYLASMATVDILFQSHKNE